MKLQRITKDIFSNFFTKEEPSEIKNQIDTQSFIFYKNLRELNIYKEKLYVVRKDFFKAIIFFQNDKIIYLSIKKRLILQNIQLIEKRIKNKKFSYSSIVK